MTDSTIGIEMVKMYNRNIFKYYTSSTKVHFYFYIILCGTSRIIAGCMLVEFLIFFACCYYRLPLDLLQKINKLRPLNNHIL